MKRFLAVCFAALLLSAPLAAQRTTGESFTWQGRMAAGTTLQIRNVNGAVRVERATGDAAEILANKSWTRGDPTRVVIEAVRYGASDANVVVCAMWDPSGTCTENGSRGNDRTDRETGNVSVAFTVRLPAGVNARLHTVNGAIDVSGATGQVTASTVNGDVSVATSAATLSASTVNGSIAAAIGAGSSSEELNFSTVNGSITLTLPDQFNADLAASTVTGSINPEFPVTVQGRIGPRNLRAQIGNGGRPLSVSTVNGSITLRRN